MVTTQPTCTEEGLATYTCSKCGDSYTEAIPVLDHDYVDGVCAICGFAAPRATIICSNGASVTVYETKSFEGACVENAAFANPRNSDTGLIDCSGDGQINFVVNLETGYDLESVSAEPAGAYKNLKGPSDTGVENGYRLTKVSGDLTITVTTAANAYTVTWKSQDGSQILETDEDVPYGTAPDFGLPDPTKQANAQYAYEFAGWAANAGQTSGAPEGELTVTGDMTYYAAFSETLRAYPITFVNDDGTVLQSSDVAYGYTPAYTGATPAKAPDAQYTYTFAGWDPAIASVSGPATYTATYSAEEIGHTVSLNNLTNGKAEITVISDGGSYSGEVTFKGNCAAAGAVRSSTDGGDTYTSLTPESDGSYTLEIDQDMLIAVNVMGDINGDGDVNNKDVTRLMRYIKYKDVEVVDFALDVNGDGSVNNKDATRLMRYIKYNDVEIS